MPLKFPFVSFFLFNLLCSTLFTISSYSWLGAWTGLEFNLISFVPLLMANATPSSTESAVKYFIIQAFSSALLLLSFLLSTLIILNPPLGWIILASLMLKVGIAPLHHWVPNIATSLSWPNLFILLSWQKLAPLALMSHFLSNPMNSKLLMVFSSISALVGGLGGMNQTQVRVILAFSSIGHMGWTLACVLMSTCAQVSLLPLKAEAYS